MSFRRRSRRRHQQRSIGYRVRHVVAASASIPYAPPVIQVVKVCYYHEDVDIITAYVILPRIWTSLPKAQSNFSQFARIFQADTSLVIQY